MSFSTFMMIFLLIFLSSCSGGGGEKAQTLEVIKEQTVIEERDVFRPLGQTLTKSILTRSGRLLTNEDSIEFIITPLEGRNITHLDISLTNNCEKEKSTFDKEFTPSVIYEIEKKNQTQRVYITLITEDERECAYFDIVHDDIAPSDVELELSDDATDISSPLMTIKDSLLDISRVQVSIATLQNPMDLIVDWHELDLSQASIKLDSDHQSFQMGVEYIFKLRAYPKT